MIDKKQSGLKSNQLSKIGSLSLSAVDTSLSINGIPGIKDLSTSIRSLINERKIDLLDTLIFVMYSKGEITTNNIESLKKKIQDDDLLLNYLERCQHAFNNSSGSLTRRILAIYSGRVINDVTLLNNYSSSVIIHTLSSINDFDLIYFELAYDYIIAKNLDFIDSLKLFKLIKEYSDVQNTQPLDFVSSVKKLTSLMLFEELDGLVENVDDHFVIYLNEYSHTFKELIAEYKTLFQ